MSFSSRNTVFAKSYIPKIMKISSNTNISTQKVMMSFSEDTIRPRMILKVFIRLESLKKRMILSVLKIVNEEFFPLSSF